MPETSNEFSVVDGVEGPRRRREVLDEPVDGAVGEGDVPLLARPRRVGPPLPGRPPGPGRGEDAAPSAGSGDRGGTPVPELDRGGSRRDEPTPDEGRPGDVERPRA